MTTAAETLAAYAVDLRFETLPAHVVERARVCLTDAIGCAVFGIRFPWSQMVLDHAKAVGSGGPVRLPGIPGVSLHVPQAALALGTFSHAFELDSLRNPSAGVHPGATVALPAFAFAQAMGASGKALLTAIVAGTEVMGRIGVATLHAPEARGFHAPGIAGPFGSAAACASLARLDAGTTTNAFGVAGSLGGGLLAFAKAGTGGMVKRLHMGRAAEAGIVAVELARRGFEGPATVIEGKFGMLEAYCDRHDASRLTRGLGTEWESERLCIKPYALHVTAQPSVQLIRQWMGEHGFAGDDIAELTIWASPKVVSHHSNARPIDVMSAQYSTPFTVALAACHDPADPEVFNDRTLADTRVRALAERILIVERPQDVATMGVAMAVVLKDGRRIEGHLDHFRGTPEAPFSRADVKAKFDTVTRAAFSPAARERLFEALMGLEHVADMRELAIAGD
jgi:2-methylcitrate dehydratase PrpD